MPTQLQLPTRKLGRYGPDVSAVGYGTMGLSVFYGPPPPDEQRFEILDYVYQTGCTFWDSSDLYGDSEELLGKWFARTGVRNEIFLATKFAKTEEFAQDDDGQCIKDACNRSLQRLGVRTIDLYYLHHIERYMPIEKAVAALADLQREGKIRYLGLSDCSAETLRAACKVHHIAAAEVEYSPYKLDIERNGFLQTARELGVAIVAYSPLGRGLLGGQIKSREDLSTDDLRRTLTRFGPTKFHRNLKLYEVLSALGEQKGCHASTLVLAWLMAQGSDIIPIPGTTKTRNVQLNEQAVMLQLDPEEVKKIRYEIENAEAVGGPLPDGGMASSFADTPVL
ncbi:hypothetical protein DTO271G3_4527 [Paecilomyces variotii]|nr:hypothetical protein DTO271G3_4527 [Paecilomyces variotii]